MKYFSTHFIIKSEDEALKQTSREILAAIAGECGYETFLDTEDGVDGYVQVDFYDESMLNSMLEEFPIDDVEVTFSTEEVEDQDWNETWEQEQGFDPIEIDGKLVVYDVLHTDAAELDAPMTIGIHARNAFGTGTHETTQMMLSSLVSMPLECKRVLDCGCGTGILAIAALKCGAKDAVGYDIDEWSVENSRHNAELNGVGEKLQVLEGDVKVLSHVDGVFDVVVANIFREILLADMEHFKSVMNHNASLLLSGFYEEDAPLLIEKAEQLGMKHEKTVKDGEWCHLVFTL